MQHAVLSLCFEEWVHSQQNAVVSAEMGTLAEHGVGALKTGMVTTKASKFDSVPNNGWNKQTN